MKNIEKKLWLRWMRKTLVLLLLFNSMLLFAQKSTTTISERNKTFEYKSFYNLTSIELAFKGNLVLTPNEEAIKSMTPGSFLKFSKTTFGVKRSIDVQANSRGEITYRYYEGKKKVPFEGDGEKWFSDILIDVLRITGAAAEQRVARLKREGGIKVVLEEISELKTNTARKRYFAALLSTGTPSEGEISQINQSIGTLIPSSSLKARLLRKYSSKLIRGEKSAKSYFEAVERISSSSEKGVTLRYVMANHQLSATSKVALLQATEKISSSSEKGATLRAFNRQFLNNSAVAAAYFEVLNNISSSSERGATIRALLNEQQLNTANYQLAFESIGDISSDSERGATLRNALSSMEGMDAAKANAFFKSLDNISSSSERGAVLRMVFAKRNLSPEVVVYALESTNNISSNSERGSVLRSAIHTLGSSSEADRIFFEVLEGIDSSAEKGATARAAINEGKLDKNAYLFLFDAVRSISSSTEAGSVLTAAARKMPKENAEIKAGFFKAAESISSDSEYRRVIEALY